MLICAINYAKGPLHLTVERLPNRLAELTQPPLETHSWVDPGPIPYCTDGTIDTFKIR